MLPQKPHIEPAPSKSTGAAGVPQTKGANTKIGVGLSTINVKKMAATISKEMNDNQKGANPGPSSKLMRPAAKAMAAPQVLSKASAKTSGE